MSPPKRPQALEISDLKLKDAALTVGQVARLSGVTVRALHHYDAIGLLSPALVRPNGYRIYREAELLRLQEILFYREIGMPLEEIKRHLEQGDDALARLQQHRRLLVQRGQTIRSMLVTLDATIATLQGHHNMALDHLYTPFSAKQQAAHEAWLIETYGDEVARDVERSRRVRSENADEVDEALETLRQIEGTLVELFERGLQPDAAETHDALEDHRAMMTQFWGRTCDAAGYSGLAQLYRTHADFVARYEELAPRFSHWLPAAMEAHAARLASA